MLILAAVLGVLGMIFTTGIVVGLVVSLRSHAPEATLDARSMPVAAAAGAALVTTAAPVAVVPVADSIKIAPAPKNAPLAGLPDTLAAAKPPVSATIDAPVAPARVARAPSVASSAPPVKPAALTASVKRGRAPAGDSDFDAANAASELAKAQLEASLR